LLLFSQSWRIGWVRRTVTKTVNRGEWLEKRGVRAVRINPVGSLSPALTFSWLTQHSAISMNFARPASDENRHYFSGW
jgi:hypothetical protein